MSAQSERSSHPSAAQLGFLIDMLERNPDIAKGFLRTQNARQKARQFWEQAELKLNPIGGGTSKTWKQWMKYWTDKKSAVKKKVAQRAANRHQTGGRAGDVVELITIEERIVAIMGGEDFSTGDSHLRIPVIHEPSEAENEIAVTEEPIQEITLGLGTSSSILLETINTPEPIAGTSFVGPNMSYLPPSPNIAEPENVPVVHRISTPPRSSQHHPTAHTSANNTTPRRRRIQGRGRGRASPPSQRRTQFISLTERFLRVEERRVDVEQTVADVLRVMQENQSALIDAVKVLADSVTKLSEAFRNQNNI